MKIYIFNPEHDIALASNLENFTAPHAGRELRHDLCFLPSLWAENDSLVLVDNVDSAHEALRHLSLQVKAKFIDSKGLVHLLNANNTKPEICPWGWDLSLRQSLKRMGIPTTVLPDNSFLNEVRLTSNRSWASLHVLPSLREIENTIGEAKRLQSIEEVREQLTKWHKMVLKAPWSSSGRGIRYVTDTNNNDQTTYYGITPQLEGWIRNTINRQGAVMVEPYYNKVLDFGMEFTRDEGGLVRYEGLSVFDTVNGAYIGNIIDDEGHKEAILTRYIPQALLTLIRTKASETLTEVFKGSYTGPFGIDMMVVRNGDKLMVNPCVELNLRMTMGFVALLLNRKLNIEHKTMRIVYSNGRYSLNIQSL